jgi:predicted nucleic-acid-binding Zn-ribbon protein
MTYEAAILTHVIVFIVVAGRRCGYWVLYDSTIRCRECIYQVLMECIADDRDCS